MAGKKSFPLVFLYGLIVLVAVGLTLFSETFVRPADCRSLCGSPETVPCPPGTCRAFAQRAGLPLPFRVDDPGGGSPTGGWGILGPEDLPNPLFFLLDVFFYGLALGWLGYLFQLLRGKAAPELLAILVPLALLLIILASGYLLYRPVLGS